MATFHPSTQQKKCISYIIVSFSVVVLTHNEVKTIMLLVLTTCYVTPHYFCADDDD